MTINVTDPDRNEKSDVRDSVEVLIKSTTYPLGISVTLLETDVNTGVFSGRIYIKETGLPGAYEIIARTGDTITVEYTDPYNETGLEEVITATASVGVPMPTYPVPASTPGMLSSEFTPVTNATVGTQVYINATVTNTHTEALYVVVFVQVLDAEGHPVYFTYHIYPSLSAGLAMSSLDAWTPTEAGTYTIRILVTDALVGGKAISEPVEITFEVVA